MEVCALGYSRRRPLRASRPTCPTSGGGASTLTPTPPSSGGRTKETLIGRDEGARQEIAVQEEH